MTFWDTNPAGFFLPRVLFFLPVCGVLNVALLLLFKGRILLFVLLYIFAQFSSMGTSLYLSSFEIAWKNPTLHGYHLFRFYIIICLDNWVIVHSELYFCTAILHRFSGCL